MKKKNLLLVLVSLTLIIGGGVTNYLVADEETTLDVGQAITDDEKIDVATRELSLNTNLDTIVTDIKLPVKGLYSTTINWSCDSANCSIDETNNKAIIVRPEANAEAIKVDLVATVTLQNGKDNILTRNKTFNLTILPKKTNSSSESTEIIYLNENFSSYALGDDVGEYLAWNLNVSDGQTKIVDSVPNNNMISNKALQISSKKSATEVRYTANFYATNTIAVEGYVLLNDKVNGIHFDLGANDSFGPSFGISNDGFYCYNNGDKLLSTTTPTIDVWYKFRIEANTLSRMYSVGIYKMDGTNSLVSKANIAYATSNKYLNKFRIRIDGGDKVGEVYLSNLTMGLKENMPVVEGSNPNREDGIGTIENFNENVLFVDNEVKTYDIGFIVHNRFDDSETYTINTDYTLEKETISSTDELEINKYHIVLLATGETLDLIQNVYKSTAVGLPSIVDFKGSHLAQKVLDSAGTLSSTGTITITGSTSRKDGTIYYGVKLAGSSKPTIAEIKEGGSSFITSGSFKQENRNISHEIPDLAITNSYDLYVFMENANGVSEIYEELNISTIINITTCDEFYDMTVNVNTYKNEFRLENDLDFSNYTWKYDPTILLKWKGTLDGQGHTISNLTIASPGRKAAIFAEISGGTVKNLKIVNPTISGLQDCAVICGYSNGADISNVEIINANVSYNNNDGSEGYFAIVCGRLFEGTTNMTNVFIKLASITCNKYTGVLTGNVNKDHNCVLNATNIYCNVSFNCEGAAVGLIGRNRGTSNLNNVVAILNIVSAKKEMGIVAGHNKEGGSLNVSKIIGKMDVRECAQPTYFNHFIGSHDANTSSYTFSDCYFIEGDYSLVTDNFNPIVTTRTCGNVTSSRIDIDKRWWEENSFIESFELDPLWDYDEETNMPIYNLNKVINVTSTDVNNIINMIKGDYSKDDHYYIRKATILYNYLSENEKASVDKAKLDKYIEDYNNYYELIETIGEIGGLY